MGNIKECTEQELNFYENYFVNFYNSQNPDKGYNIKAGGYKPANNGQERPIIDINTKQEYQSISKCAKDLGLNIGDIVRVCNHSYSQVKGYRFMYLDEYNKNGEYIQEQQTISYKAKSVKCLDNDIIYESCHDAANKLNLNFRAISAVCLGKRKSTKGYHFCYIN